MTESITPLAAAPAAKHGREPIRLLLVEDSTAVRWRLRAVIEESCSVQIVGEAESVAAARTLFHQHKPEAVVLDLQLTDGDAKPLIAEFKRACPACLRIVLTSYGDPECRDVCTGLGANHFFDKARDFERVPQVLASLRS